MRGRLALLLPALDPEGACVYTIEELDEDDQPVRRVHSDFFTHPSKMDHLISAEPHDVQLGELKALIRSFRYDGLYGWALREEGGCAALPPESNMHRWRMLRGSKEQRSRQEQLLKTLPVLRLYCSAFHNSLVLYGGGVKTADTWQGSPDVRPLAEEGNAIHRSLQRAFDKGQLLLDRNGHFDLPYCDPFTWYL